MATQLPAHFSDPHLWTIDSMYPSRSVWDRIFSHYVTPLIEYYQASGIALIPNRGSCYRSPAHELTRGRSGNSLHCFPALSSGACDLVRLDGLPIATVLDDLCLDLPFRRIAFYPNNHFVHVDYGDRGGVQLLHKQLFTCSSITAEWVHQSNGPQASYFPICRA